MSFSLRSALALGLSFASSLPAALAADQCVVTNAGYTSVALPNANSNNCNLPAVNPLSGPGSDATALSRHDGETIVITWSRDGAPADSVSVVGVRVALLDHSGNPIKRPIKLSLQSSRGRIVTSDNTFTRATPPKFLEDRDRREPGVQILVTGGTAEFNLIAPDQAGDALVRVSSGDLDVEAKLRFVPDLRAALAVGIVEAQVSLSRTDTQANTPTIRPDGLEDELNVLADTSTGRDYTSLSGRGAFFYKGTVQKEWLVTAAFDSDKERIRLFRDIQPDQFYPIYGDSSIKGFDAQSSRRGYLRVEHDRSYLLFGDYTTDGGDSDLRNLGQYNRALTGAKAHIERGFLSANFWGAYDSVTQVIDEQPGRGVSGPYAVSNASGITNSERVEIVVRDRNQPSVILSIQPLVRFADYEFEPFSGRLLFRKPIPTLDENLNPISIRVTFEVDQGGPQFTVAGADMHLHLGSHFEVGAAYSFTEDPATPYALGSANAAWRFNRDTVLLVESAQSDRAATLVQQQSTGYGFRSELRHRSANTDLRMYYGRTTHDFDNPSASLNGGRDESGGKWTYRFSKRTDFVAEALQSEDVRVGAARRGASVALGHWFNDKFRIEGGLRYFDDRVNSSSPSSSQTTYASVYNLVPAGSIGTGAFVNGVNPASGENATAHVKLTEKLGPKSQLYAEGEQGLQDSNAYAYGVGGDYQVFDKARLYARHEFAKSLASQYGLNDGESRRATIFGVDSSSMRDGSAFGEYRLRDAIDGRDSEAAMGLRNLWPLGKSLAASTGFERVQVLDGSGRTATAYTLGLENTAHESGKGSVRTEYREDDTAQSWLGTLAYTRKLSRDWSLLFRDLYNRTANVSAALGQVTQNRSILGAAYRDTDTNLWSTLLRWESKYERDTGLTDPLTRRTQILSAHFNYHPNRPLTLSGQLAAKWVTEAFPGVADNFDAYLIGGRAMYDVTERWDVGLVANTLFGGGSRQYAIGAETGYSIVDNLWLSVGYNVSGFSDNDLVASDYTRKGPYIRLRFKFDEKLFRGKDPEWNNALTPGGSAHTD